MLKNKKRSHLNQRPMLVVKIRRKMELFSKDFMPLKIRRMKMMETADSLMISTQRLLRKAENSPEMHLLMSFFTKMPSEGNKKPEDMRVKISKLPPFLEESSI